MSETQSITEPRAENSVNGTAAQAGQAESSASGPAAKAAAVVEALRGLGTSWAEVAIGYGKVALEGAARALERTAGKLGDLQGKLKKGDVAAAEGAR
ncbi:hypothetical protein [Sorangium sp. So ce131]|uniref:hypothetical protein n=1 Tax=Sorangium sp. So ce131 TaxID=3133282 RepID=UPI003F5E2474